MWAVRKNDAEAGNKSYNTTSVHLYVDKYVYIFGVYACTKDSKQQQQHHSLILFVFLPLSMFQIRRLGSQLVNVWYRKVTLLLERGATVSYEGISGLTAMHVAAQCGR